MTTIAFLGTGTMGFAMARNLAESGFTLRAWNRSLQRAEPLAEHGATICDDPREAVEGADVLITMLSDSATVLDTAKRALEGGEDKPVWVQMSTVGLEGTALCQDLADELCVTFVDAPVLGTRQPADERKLVILVSGPSQALDTCRPVFEALGHRVLELGEAGRATRAKVAVNSWVLGVTGLIAETIQLAESLGIDPQVFFDAVEGGTLDLPYARLKGKLMIERDFDEAAFKLSLARKDADLVLAAAEQEALDAPVLRAVAERLRRAESDGYGEADMAANYLATAPASSAQKN